MNKLRILSTIGLLIWLPINNFSQHFDIGEINSAKYKICIPENWNKGLVMYAHGYEEIGEEGEIFTEVIDDFMEIFTSRGFAYAASNYKRQGMVIKDGIEDTEALRTYFKQKYGKPNICIVTGHSMGGTISLAIIEKYPSEYDGALPLCGWLAPAYSWLKYGLDMLACYDYLFGDNDGQIVTGKDFVDSEIIQEKLYEKPEMTKLFAEHFRVREDHLADVVSFYQFTIKESTGWLGGLPIGNAQTIYSGFGENIKTLNKDILRYEADPGAQEYFLQYYTPTGEILDPVLALHTSYDELLPVLNYEYYDQLTEIKHTSDNYIQQYVVRDGHCEITIEEIDRIFEQLLLWIREDMRPVRTYP